MPSRRDVPAVAPLTASPLATLVVVCGAAAGASTRWAAGEVLGSGAFPWALLVVNVVGSFVLGLVTFRAARGARELVRLGVGIGFCGSLTTFSSLAVTLAHELDAGRYGAAAEVTSAHLVVGLVAVGLGVRLRHRLWPLRELA